MKNRIDSVEKLINSFTKLPTVGQKTAERYAYAVINMPLEDVEDWSKNLLDAKKNVKFCKNCWNWSDNDVCDYCLNRNAETICVVKEPKDVFAMERVNGFNGQYHVLHGTISPLANKGPDDIKIKELLERISRDHTKEVVLALNSDVEGEATSMYLARLLKPLGVKVTKLAQGISMGSDIEYADDVTLSRAYQDRREV